MEPERLDLARTVESIAAVPAPGRPPWAGAGLVQHPPRAVGLAAGAAVGLLGASVAGHGGLIFSTVDAVGGRSVGAGRRNRPCVAGIGIVPARGHAAWAGLQRGLPCVGRIEPVRPVEGGAGPAAGKQPRHGSRYRGRDPGLAASGRGSEHAPATPPSPRAASWTEPRRVVAKVEWPSGELYPRVGLDRFHRSSVTNLSRPAEQWIKEGKNAIKWTRLSCRSLRNNAVRLQLHALAYNLGNFMRTLALPDAVEQWSLTTLREKLVKIGAKVVSHGRYVTFRLAEVAVPRSLFQKILSLIDDLRRRPAPA